MFFRQRIPSHTCKNSLEKSDGRAARRAGHGCVLTVSPFVLDVVTVCFMGLGWVCIGSSPLCASHVVAVSLHTSLLAMIGSNLSLVGSSVSLCVSVCNLFFMFFFMCFVMYRFMFLFMCIFMGLVSLRAVAVLLGQGARHKTICASALFEVHVCIRIVWFHYPGYPVEQSFFFPHFALVYIEIKLLFVLSEFPATSCHAFPGAMQGVKSTSRHQALNLIGLSWFAWKEGSCSLYRLLFIGDLAFGMIEIFATTPLNLFNQFLVLLLMSCSHIFYPNPKSIHRAFERHWHFETSSSHWLWWSYRGNRYCTSLHCCLAWVPLNQMASTSCAVGLVGCCETIALASD